MKKKKWSKIIKNSDYHKVSSKCTEYINVP